MDVLNLIPEKLQFFLRIIFLFFMFTIVLATFAFILLGARSKLQKLKEDHEGGVDKEKKDSENIKSF